MSTLVIYTPLGNLRLVARQKQVCQMQFTEDEPTTGPEGFLANVATELEEYFNGQRSQLSFDLAPEGTEFQQKVWQELKTIPYGETISYQALANRLGQPTAVRAVAAANSKNPIAIAIPCHRVIGSNGSMTGYAGGLERKKALLRLEGADIFSQTELFNEF